MRPETPIPPPSIPDELIERCLAGRCEGPEGERVRAYLAVTPGVARYYQSLRSALGSDGAGSVREDAERAYAALMQQLRAEVDGAARPNAPQVRRSRWPWGGEGSSRTYQHRVRAVVGVALVAGLVAVATWRSGAFVGSHRVAPVPTVYVTQNGQRASILLPDGSTVMLNVASRLEIPADFAAGNRSVHLFGEALFSVTHHTGTPFTVVTGGVATRVLGTTFMIRHYAADTTSVVAVRDGKVAVRSTVVTAQQQAVVGRTGAVGLRPADPAQFTFATGVLTLNGVPLRDAIAELDRWYDADIRLGDPTLGKNLIQGAFAAGSLADLVKILGFTFHAQVVREGRVITLYPR